MIVLTQRNLSYNFGNKTFRFFFQEVTYLRDIADVRNFIQKIDEIGDGIFNKDP